MGKGFLTILGGEKISQPFKGTSLAQTGSFDVLSLKIGSAVWVVPSLMNPPPPKQIKMPSEDEHVGYVPWKIPTSDFFLNLAHTNLAMT